MTRKSSKETRTKTIFFQKRMAWVFFGFPIPAFRTARWIASIRAKWEWYGIKNPIKKKLSGNRIFF